MCGGQVSLASSLPDRLCCTSVNGLGARRGVDRPHKRWSEWDARRRHQPGAKKRGTSARPTGPARRSGYINGATGRKGHAERGAWRRVCFTSGKAHAAVGVSRSGQTGAGSSLTSVRLELSPMSTSEPLEYVVPAVRSRDGAVDLERIPLHPVVAQQAIRAHFPDRRPAHLEGRAVRLGAHEAVVAAGHPPTRGHATAVLVLERLDDMEFELAHLRLEVLHPSLERLAAHDVPAAGGDDEILMHQAIDGLGVLWLLPHLAPEVLDDRDTVLRHA